MSGPWWTRFIVLKVMIIAAVIALLPTIYPMMSSTLDTEDRETWPGWYEYLYDHVNHITLGLDLQGGLHLQYQVDVDKAISDRLDRYTSELRVEIQEFIAADDALTGTVSVTRVEDSNALRVVTDGVSARDVVSDDIMRRMNLVPAMETNGAMRLELDPDYVEETRRYAVEQAIDTIRRRIDDTGVREPSISRRGDTDIIIQLPGATEAEFEDIKQLIETTAQLEFRMLHEADATFFRTVDYDTETFRTVNSRPMSDELDPLRELFANQANAPPEGSVVRFMEIEDYDPEVHALVTAGYQPILVEAVARLTGEYVAQAQVSNDPQTNRPYVALEFDRQGGRLFGEMTQQGVGNQMAIVLDEIVVSAPVINEPILGGRASISMGGGGSYNETYTEAERLVIALRNGALPAPIEKQFETQVGPTLGAASVRSGAISLVVALILVFLFVVFYYKGSGLVANTALALNMLFILAALSLLGATLTLPGIAGMTLTIGMAIDANVIIFERIKEELALGKSVRAAVDTGYSKAMSAVMDANITTGIACVVLMQFGSGPIKGFAITLFYGIICSLYTAIIVTRLIFEFFIDGRKIQRLSI